MHDVTFHSSRPVMGKAPAIQQVAFVSHPKAYYTAQHTHLSHRHVYIRILLRMVDRVLVVPLL